jgi:hypothetical protein
MTLITRQGKGSKLTIQEMDGNLTGLNTGKFQGDTFRELVKDNIGLDIPESGFYQGSEKIDGISRFNPGEIFDILQEEDFEALKSPVLDEEGDYIIYSGTRAGGGDLPIIILNGILFPQGGDGTFGAGTFQVTNQLDDEEEDPFYLESLNLGFINFSYRYNYDSENERHFHTAKIDFALFGAGFAVIELEVDDDATEWAEVSVYIESLQPPNI